MKRTLLTLVLAGSNLLGCGYNKAMTKEQEKAVPISIDFSKINVPEPENHAYLEGYKFPDSDQAYIIASFLSNASEGRLRLVTDRTANKLNCRADYTTEKLEQTIDKKILEFLDQDGNRAITMTELMRTYFGVCYGEIDISSLKKDNKF